MNAHFKHTKTLYGAWLLIFGKIVATLLFLPAMITFQYHDFVAPFAYQYLWHPCFMLGFSSLNDLVVNILTVFLGILFLLFIITCALLPFNRKSAGFASIALIVYCGMDILWLLLFPTSPYNLLGVVFNLVVIALLLILHRFKKPKPPIQHAAEPGGIL